MTNKNKIFPDYKEPDYEKRMSRQLTDQIERYNKLYR